jgi:hypothetical protein
LAGRPRLNYLGVRCDKCGSDTTIMGGKYDKRKDGTIVKYPHPLWYRNATKTGYWCNRCYHSEKEYKTHQKVAPIGKSTYEYDLHYKDKRYSLKTAPRIGVCNWCRSVKGLINAQTGRLCKITQRHHEGDYIDSDKLANTLEICASCHSRYEMDKRLKLGIRVRRRVIM